MNEFSMWSKTFFYTMSIKKTMTLTAWDNLFIQGKNNTELVCSFLTQLCLFMVSPSEEKEKLALKEATSKEFKQNSNRDLAKRIKVEIIEIWLCYKKKKIDKIFSS